MLKRNLAHIIATDAHSPERRPPLLEHAVREAARFVGQEQARDLVTRSVLGHRRKER